MICQNVCNLNIPRENQRHLLKLGKKPIHDKKEVPSKKIIYAAYKVSSGTFGRKYQNLSW